MKYLYLKATFSDNVNSDQKDTYTLCGKNDINPVCVFTFNNPYPIKTDFLILRDPQYKHSPYIYGFGLPIISYPDNGWAWVNNSSLEHINLPLPCFQDGLALNHSNSIQALAVLVKTIAKERKISAQAEVHQRIFEALCSNTQYTPPTTINVDCELPQNIKLHAYFFYNNEKYSLHLYAKFNSDVTSIVKFTINPFNQNAPHISTPNISYELKKNILEAIADTIDTVQRSLWVKVYFYDMDCKDLIVQPVL